MTSFREALVAKFQEEGITVVPYNFYAENERYVIVRPAGVIDDREQCSVIAVNMMANYLDDPDEGMAEHANRVHGILRLNGVSVVGSETVEYLTANQDATRGEFRVAILFTVSSTQRGLK